MRIILTEQEILMAIEDFILDTVNVPDDVRVDIDLKATRGEQGYTAEIDLLQLNEPEGSRAVDDRIEPTTEARAEGLDIVGKIDAARSEAKAPRRRGRPAGSKNLPKELPDNGPDVPATDVTPAADMIADAVANHPAHEPNEETQQAMQAVRDGDTVKTDTVDETVKSLNAEEVEAVTEIQAETADTPEVIDAPVEQPVEPPVEAPAPEVAAADVSTQVSTKRSLFENVSDAGDDKAADVIADAPEPNSEAALAAEAAATEPAEEEDEPDYTPTPETPGLSSEDAPAPTPRRSLFADLTKPTN